jgi:hypothetical protein
MRHAERELVHVELAEQNRAGVSQSAYDRGVLFGNPAREYSRPARRPDAGRLEEILDRDRDPVQRASMLPASDLVIGAGGFLSRTIGEHRDEAVELPVEPFDARNTRVHDIAGR